MLNNKKDLKNIAFPISIVLASIILGGFFYAIQMNKQDSIERQHIAELEENRRLEDARILQENKKYFADRKDDCLSIYKTENDKWNNVRGWRYDEGEDKCYIRYSRPEFKSEAQCDEDFPVSDDWGNLFLRDNLLCKDGEFENSF